MNQELARVVGYIMYNQLLENGKGRYHNKCFLDIRVGNLCFQFLILKIHNQYMR